MSDTIKIGLFADLHYSAPGIPEREHGSQSLARLEKGIEKFRKAGVDFAVSLGDNTHNAGNREGQLEAMKAICNAAVCSEFPTYLCSGNHEFTELTPEDVKEIWKRDGFFYSFVVKGVRFIVLDTCIRPDGVHFSMDNFDWTKSMLGEKQLEWLEHELEESLVKNDKCVIFTHGNIFCADFGGVNGSHYMIAEHEKVCAMIEKAGNVEYVFQGHRHAYDRREAYGTCFISIPAGMGEDDRMFSVYEIRSNI